MTTKSMPCCAFNRRHLARSSKMFSPGVSSMNNGASLNLPTREYSCWYSCSSRLPFRNLSLLISVSEEINRCTNCTALISKLKIATGI